MEIQSAYIPEIAEILEIRQFTEKERFYRLKLLSGKPLNNQPGQFVEVTVFGVGEAPISVSSPPSSTEPVFELCVREVGSVTTALTYLAPGDKVGIRGPFGKGFPVEEFKGYDILFIAGGLGIVPLRSLIKYTLEYRHCFGFLDILYGTRTPGDILFRDELISWRNRQDLNLLLTVDIGYRGWIGNVGVITTLFPLLRKLEPVQTKVAVCGPPVMYKFIIRELRDIGIPDENIYFSLERKMKCGLGKCGHCQINNVYVCQEGPVFNYALIKQLEEAI